ncbi:MAG: hypothetical protein ACOY94_03565 [Bacillota bacterium]
MHVLQRLEEHFTRREWLHVDREATRLIMLESLSDKERGQVYRCWGRAKAGLNEINAAIRLLEQAAHYAQREQDWDCLGFARADLGALYTTIGNLSSGMDCLRAYLTDLDRYEEAATCQGKVRFNLALAYKYRRQYREAVSYYREALDWFTLRGLTTELGMAHRNLAWLYCILNQLEEARTHLELADTYRDTLTPEFDAEQICCWAFYYWKAGKVGSAMDCVQEILLTGRPGVDAHHRGQAALIGGHIALLLGQRTTAEQLLDLAMCAAIDTNDRALAEECTELRGKLDSAGGGGGTAG